MLASSPEDAMNQIGQIAIPVSNTDRSEAFYEKTLGLRKIGRHEIQTSLQEADEEVIVLALIHQVGRILFSDNNKQLPLEVTQHGDVFVVSESAMVDGRIEVKIVRRIES